MKKTIIGFYQGPKGSREQVSEVTEESIYNSEKAGDFLILILAPTVDEETGELSKGGVECFFHDKEELMKIKVGFKLNLD